MGKFKELFILLIIGLVLFTLYPITHEYTHKTTLEDKGLETEMNINPFSEKNLEHGLFMSITHTNSGLTSQEYRDMKAEQTMIDITGYQLLPIYVLLVLIALHNLYIHKQLRRKKRVNTSKHSN